MNKTMSVTLDIRENVLAKKLTELEIPHQLLTLDIGDIDIVGTKGQRFLLERKTVSDLAASLRDGRFKNQKDRLLGVLQREPSTAIAYILEGSLGMNDTKKVNGRITVGVLRSLLNTIQFRYRIPVVTTQNITDTALLIKGLLRQMTTNPDFCPIGSGGSEGCAGHANLLPQINKNTKTDRQSLWTSMLTVLRGVNTKTSAGIISHFETLTPGGMIVYIREHTREEFETTLKTIRINRRRIPNPALERIVNMLYPTTDTPTTDTPTTDTPTTDTPTTDTPTTTKTPTKRQTKKEYNLWTTTCQID